LAYKQAEYKQLRGEIAELEIEVGEQLTIKKAASEPASRIN
jgi:hypothetical protein